jgi:hypothetical protein
VTDPRPQILAAILAAVPSLVGADPRSPRGIALAALLSGVGRAADPGADVGRVLGTVVDGLRLARAEAGDVRTTLFAETR